MRSIHVAITFHFYSQGRVSFHGSHTAISEIEKQFNEIKDKIIFQLLCIKVESLLLKMVTSLIYRERDFLYHFLCFLIYSTFNAEKLYILCSLKFHSLVNFYYHILISFVVVKFLSYFICLFGYIILKLIIFICYPKLKLHNKKMLVDI